ncbi:MAG: ABC transporter substrate-binding protein, partial [Sorangiineae bacterium]|nr:ABC transporter substrate-binding protein [Sorangiineae bacterium]
MTHGYRRAPESSRKWRGAALAVAFGALACGRAPGPEGARPLELVIPTGIATLDPRFSTRALDVKATRLVHAGLVGLEPTSLAPVPLVAASWRRLGERALEITLRAGVRFHSGRALTPEDVCATLSALGDERLGSPHREVVRAIGSCQVDGPLTLTLRLAAPRATLLTDLEVPILRADEVRRPPQPSGELDGLGPYRIARADGDVIELEPADTGVLPRPRHAVTLRTVRDENARALRLLAGRADVAPNAISPALLPALEGRDGLEVVSRRGANVTYLLMQNDRPELSRVEVRHAIARAIDRRLIVETLLAGRGEPARELLPPGHWAEDRALAAEPFDPAAARPVLEPLPPLTLLTSTDRARVTIARAIAQM